MTTRQLTFNAVALTIIAIASIGQAIAQQADPKIKTFVQPDTVNQLRQSMAMGIPTSNCHNVIHLMMTNRMRQRANQIGTPEIYLPHMTVGTKIGDLKLTCVNLVRDGDHCHGPVFQIGMRNNSAVPIGNFQVSLVGILGQIHIHSPTTTITIDCMDCGEEKHIQMQLPMTCMRAFDSLVVAVDSCDELLECDELNNIQILKRCEIKLLVTETTAVAPVEIAPLPNPNPVVTTPKIPRPPSPLDGLNFDNLDSSDAKNLLFRR